VDLKAGQTYTIGLEMNWDDEEKARDFSVVVNGMGGGVVTVTESTGKTSATLPVIYREGT
jgi:hypothetical protein